METFQLEEWKKAGLPCDFVQDNQSKSRKGVLRGLHFQRKNPQGKLVRVISGEVYDVCVDLRKNSPTFGENYGIILSSENKKQIYIPEGFAHGFVVLSENAEFFYKCTRLYAPEDEGGLRWNDPDLDINWQLPESEIQLSEKDKMHPFLKNLDFQFEV
jgi:dTDP-4-dehydrorhamnose 3,5-epimerase